MAQTDKVQKVNIQKNIQSQAQYDFLARWVERIVTWIVKHPQTALSVAVVLASSILLASYIYFNLKRVEKVSWERFAMAQSYVQAGKGDVALNILGDIIQRYSRRSVGAYAYILKGDINYQTGKFEDAQESYKNAMQVAQVADVIPVAIMGLAASEENLNNIAGAISHYQDFIKRYPEHFLAPNAYIGLARMQELDKKPDDAAGTYEKIITLYPTSIWAQKARFRITMMHPAEKTPQITVGVTPK